MIVKVIQEKDFKISFNQMVKNDLEITKLNKSGKPMEVMIGVRLIEFVKNRSKKRYILVYPEPRNIIKEIFEITHGKIVRVSTEIKEQNKSLKTSKNLI